MSKFVEFITQQDILTVSIGTVIAIAITNDIRDDTIHPYIAISIDPLNIITGNSP